MLNIQPPSAPGGNGESDDEGSSSLQRGKGSRRRQMDTFGGDVSSGEEEEEEEDGRGRRVRDPSSIDPSYRISPPGTPKEESKYQDQARHRTPSSSSRRGHPHVSVRYAAPSISPRGKFLRILPVVFVLLLVACLGCIYFLFHIIPLMQGRGGEGSSQQTTDSRYARGLGEGIVFGILLVLQLICFFLAVVTPPGFVPPEFSSEAEEGSMLLQQTEAKRSGERRECKWCLHYKPDRTHHCRVCRTCILKMDHHCPWIDNCVGWRNHKSFLLSVFYSSLLCIYLGATMFESVERAINATSVEFSTLFLLLFGETLDFFLSIIVTGFFVFHLYLMLNGMTTIEFCEKQYRWRANREHEGEEETRYQSVWDRGAWKNFNDTFGSNPLLWFLPIDNRPGNGINFIANRSFRPSTHPSHIRLDQEEEGRRLRAGKDL